MREFAEAQHGGLEVAPESHIEVVHHSTIEVLPVSGLEATPDSNLEVSPERHHGAAQEAPIPIKFLNSPTAVELPQDATDDPSEKPSSKRARWSKKTWLTISAIVLLLLLVVGLGAGLGIASKRRDSSESRTGLTAGNGTTQSSQTTSSQASTRTSGASPSTTLTGAITPTGTSPVVAYDLHLNDQLTTNKTMQWWYFGQTKAQIDQLCIQNNARITQIRVDNGTIPTFTVLMIDNTGLYKLDWSWYVGTNSTALATTQRLVSIDPYMDAQGVLQFAAVFVPNANFTAKGWWWYFGQSSTAISGLLLQYNARLVALRGYNVSGITAYVIIMAQNSDPDYAVSEFHIGISIADISARVAAGLRLISLSPNPAGNWDTILVQNPGQKWGWWYGLTTQTVAQTSMQNDFRIVDISPYRSNGVLQFATVETDNSG